MPGFNHVILVGHLGADPDASTTSKGENVTKMRIATQRYKSDECDWHQVVVFGSAAEACDRFLHKGAMVLVAGRIQYREHEGKWYTTIIANTVEFLKTDKKEADKSHTGKTPPKKGKPDEDDRPPF